MKSVEIRNLGTRYLRYRRESPYLQGNPSALILEMFYSGTVECSSLTKRSLYDTTNHPVIHSS